MRKIKALILDAGGVLVHPLHGNWNVPVKYRELLGEYARDIGSDAWLDACRAEAAILREDVFVENLDAECALKLQFLKNVAARLDWKLSEKTMAALAEDFTYNPARHAWYGDVEEWLKKWHMQMKLGILSDAMPSCHLVVNSLGCRECVDALVISTEIGVAKPDARMYMTVCEKLGMDPADCLFVDDRECNLRGAMACGMAAVQMCRDGLENWDGPYVRDLAELNRYMEGLN